MTKRDACELEFDLEAVYQGLDTAEAACRSDWAALFDAIATARAAADALRGGADQRPRAPVGKSRRGR